MPRSEVVQQQPPQGMCGMQEQILKRSEEFRRQLAIDREANDRWYAEMKKFINGISVRAGNAGNHGVEVLSKVTTRLEVATKDEDLMKHCFGVENPPSVDAPQVLDESPKRNPDISSDDWVDEGQVKTPVGSQNTVCEQLDGLNLSNGSLENSGLYVQEESSEDAKSEVCTDEELHMPAKHSMVLDLNSLFENPICPELQVEYSQIMEGYSGQMIDFDLDGLMPLFKGGKKCWFHGWKDANSYCLFVFDPGVLRAVIDTYWGFWVADKKHGKGEKLYANGDAYEGEWRNNVQDGEGKYVWRNGVISRKGLLIWANGNRYEGFWETGGEKECWSSELETLYLGKDNEAIELLRKAHDVLQAAMANSDGEFGPLMVPNSQPVEPERMPFRSHDRDVAVGSPVALYNCTVEENIVDLVHPDVIPELKCIANIISGYGCECSQAYVNVGKNALNRCVLILAVEPLNTEDVLRRAGAVVTVASVEKELQINTCHGVKLMVDSLINDRALSVFDLISLSGGMPGAATLRDCKVFKVMVEKQAADGGLYAATCAAPAVAGEFWGLFIGIKEACYPSFMEQLSSSASAVESQVQQDGKEITSRGPGTAMEYCVAFQAIGFWSSKCAKEIEIQESFGWQSGKSEPPHSHLIERALPFLVPMLLETLLKQEEDQDQDDNIWNLSMGSDASGKNERIHCSLNINTETERLSARNQPAFEKARYKISQAFIAGPGNSLIVADYGQLELRILAHLADCKSMKKAFKAGGDFHSWTAMNIADTTEPTLQSSAYETWNKVARCAKVLETAQISQHLLLAIMNKLFQSFDLPLDKEKQGELQIFLCGVPQDIIQKLSNYDETRLSVLQIATDKSKITMLTSYNLGKEDPLNFLDDRGVGDGWPMQDFLKYREHAYYPLAVYANPFRESSANGRRTLTLNLDDLKPKGWENISTIPSLSDKRDVGSAPSLYSWNDPNEPSVLNGPEVTMPQEGLQPWGVFDPEGMIFLLTWLLLHTIHNLEAEGAVFDPGKIVVLRMTNAASSWSGAGGRVVMEGWFCASPMVVQAQGAVTDRDELGMLAAEPGPLSKKAGKEGLPGSCMQTWKQGFLPSSWKLEDKLLARGGH